jgi:hypothetical protein
MLRIVLSGHYGRLPADVSFVLRSCLSRASPGHLTVAVAFVFAVASQAQPWAASARASRLFLMDVRKPEGVL